MKIFIIGSGGHARVAADAARSAGHEIVAHRDAAAADAHAVFNAHDPRPDACFVAIGFNPTRQAVCEALAAEGVPLATIVHARACVASDVAFGKNVMVMAGAVINTGSRIGDGCIVNTSASVDHDCKLGPFSAMAPGATLGGDVTIGECTWIGLGASIIHGIAIGEHTVIAAGAVVTRDIAAMSVAAGVPCRVVRSRKIEERYL